MAPLGAVAPKTKKNYFEKNTNNEASQFAVFLQTFECNLKKTVDIVQKTNLKSSVEVMN